MDPVAVVRALEGNSGNLISEVTAELKSNLGTSHYHRLSEQEMVQRHSYIFQALTQWLLTRDEKLLEKDGESLGERRFREGTPLGQVVLALILIEKHLDVFAESGVLREEKDVRKALRDFFQKFTYYVAIGYEAVLAVSNRMAKTERGAGISVPEDRPVKPAASVSKERDMEISRGGQVGEYSG